MYQAQPKTLLRFDGAHLAYHRSSGAEPGVVFLGGYKSDMTGTKALALETWCREQGRAFVRFDYLGHGASSGRFEEGTIGRWTEDTIAVIDQLTEGPQVLVGSSMGSWLMLLAALARPLRIAGLIGIAAAADFSEDLLWARFDQVTRDRLRKEGRINLASEYDEEPYPITLRFIEEGRRHLLLRDTIALRCPVRLVHGMRDTDVPWQTSLRIAEHLAGEDVRLILIKDGEHRMSRVADLALVADILDEIIDTITKSGSRGGQGIS